MKKNFCDRCGKEILDSEFIEKYKDFKDLPKYIVVKKIEYKHYNYGDTDLCKNCLDDLEVFMDNLRQERCCRMEGPLG